MRRLALLFTAALCLAPIAWAQHDEEAAADEPSAYETQLSSDTQPGENPSAQPAKPEGKKFSPDMFKSGSSGGWRVDPLGDMPQKPPEPSVCDLGGDHPSLHRPAKVKPFDVEDGPNAMVHEYRHMFNGGLIDINCCYLADLKTLWTLWACRRMNRVLANSAGCPYDYRGSTTTAPVAGNLGVNLGENNVPLAQQQNIQKVQYNACQALNEMLKASRGNDLKNNCDQVVAKYREYVDWVGTTLFFKGRFAKRCEPGSKRFPIYYPELPPPPPAR